MIEFTNVSRSLLDEKRGKRTSLCQVTLALPPRALVALIGADHAEASLMLHLVAGSETPDSGTVMRRGTRFSPIMNAGGVPSGALVPQITALDNIRFFARLHGIKSDALIRLVDGVCGLGSRLKSPVRHLDPVRRRALEITLIAALPYDCYLVDRVELLQPELRWLIGHSARRRDAGMIFATSDPVVGQQFADAGLVIENGRVRPLAAAESGDP